MTCNRHKIEYIGSIQDVRKYMSLRKHWPNERKLNLGKPVYRFLENVFSSVSPPPPPHPPHTPHSPPHRFVKGWGRFFLTSLFKEGGVQYVERWQIKALEIRKVKSVYSLFVNFEHISQIVLVFYSRLRTINCELGLLNIRIYTS